MSGLSIASNQADADAMDAVRRHHAAMAGALGIRVDALASAASSASADRAEQARQALVDWCRDELVPHARAEEETLYPPARATTHGRLLIEAMLREHQLIGRLVGEVASTGDIVRTAMGATALREVFESHLDKENDLLLPLLAGTPSVSVAALLHGMHDLLGEPAMSPAPADPSAAHSSSNGHAGHACGCGDTDESGYPELDVRDIPHTIRHATVLGALESLPSGAGLTLVAPHDPLPLLSQIGRRWPGEFSIEYLERGPSAWRLTLARTDG